MAAIVVPFRGPGGLSRLDVSEHARRAIGLAMLGDVLSACRVVGETSVVTSDADAAELAAELDVGTQPDAGGGQGAALAAVLSGRESGPVLVVNADLPCVVPHDLRSLLAATPISGIALVEADDGTTNALSLPSPQLYAPLYGEGSARRFRDHARALELECVSVALPNVADDVDTVSDLDRLALRVGPRTQAALTHLLAEVRA